MFEIGDSCPVSAGVAVGVTTLSVLVMAGRGVCATGDVETAGVIALVLQAATNMLTQIQTAALKALSTPRMGRLLLSVLLFFSDSSFAVMFVVRHKRSGCNVAGQRIGIHVTHSRHIIQSRRLCPAKLGQVLHTLYLRLGL